MKREQNAARAAGAVLGMQPRSGPFGGAPQWKQPNSLEEVITQF
jgi:hypothetical protein